VVNELLTSGSRHKYSVNGYLRQGNPRSVSLPECLVGALGNEKAQARARELAGFLAIDIPVSAMFHSGDKPVHLGCRHQEYDWHLPRRRPPCAVGCNQCIVHACRPDSCLWV
jgi:hypothetical protein